MKAITNEIGDIYDVYQGIPILFNVIKRKGYYRIFCWRLTEPDVGLACL